MRHNVESDASIATTTLASRALGPSAFELIFRQVSRRFCAAIRLSPVCSQCSWWLKDMAVSRSLRPYGSWPAIENIRNLRISLAAAKRTGKTGDSPCGLTAVEPACRYSANPIAGAADSGGRKIARSSVSTRCRHSSVAGSCDRADLSMYGEAIEISTQLSTSAQAYPKPADGTEAHTSPEDIERGAEGRCVSNGGWNSQIDLRCPNRGGLRPKACPRPVRRARSSQASRDGRGVRGC